MTVRKYSSRSQQSTLSSAITDTATSMTVVSGSALMGGKTLTGTQTYTVVIDPDTSLEEIVDVVIPRGELVEEAAAWEENINKLAAEDEDMSAYIAQLEQARDMVDSPEATGESLAQEFERFLRSTDKPGPDGNEPPKGV